MGRVSAHSNSAYWMCHLAFWFPLVFATPHVGQFQGTAPALPTILNGKRFDLAAGHSYPRLTREINESSYPRRLADAGFRLDLVTLLKPYCIEGAASCVVRPFNHGYFEYREIGYSLRLITDLTLFRHLPMYLKEKVYKGELYT